MGNDALAARYPERTDSARLSRFVRPHRRAPPPNYSRTSRSPTHSAIRLVGQSSLATPAPSSSAPGLSGSHPLRDFLLRSLLPIACLTAGCAFCCCWQRLLRIAGYYDTEGGGCDRLDPRRRPCLTAPLHRASLAIPYLTAEGSSDCIIYT